MVSKEKVSKKGQINRIPRPFLFCTRDGNSYPKVPLYLVFCLVTDKGWFQVRVIYQLTVRTTPRVSSFTFWDLDSPTTTRSGGEDTSRTNVPSVTGFRYESTVSGKVCLHERSVMESWSLVTRRRDGTKSHRVGGLGRCHIGVVQTGEC